MLLSVTNEGVNSCWINFFDPENLAKELSLLENEGALMMLNLGYAAEGTKPLATHNERKNLPKTVTYM